MGHSTGRNNRRRFWRSPQGSHRISVRAGTLKGVQLKISSSWSWRLVALVCLACAISIPFGAAQTNGAKDSASAAATSGSETAGGVDAAAKGAVKTAEGTSAAAAKNTAEPSGDGGCFRAAVGSEVAEPEDLRSVDGVLKVELAFRSFVDSKG
jgi:hypothetical protein